MRKLEAAALALGQMMDLVRRLTVAPLTHSQRVLVVAAFKSFDKLDPLTEALDGALARLRDFAADIEDSNRGGTMDDEFESQLDLARAIAAEIQTLMDEFDVDAASHVAALKKRALEALWQDPRFLAIAHEVGKARIALRRARIDTARRLQSNGVTENMSALEYWLWDEGSLIPSSPICGPARN